MRGRSRAICGNRCGNATSPRGLSGIVGLAMLIPFTYNLDEYTAFALLLGMAAVITSSDFITAVLFGVPGHVGAAATVIDGHAMARQGEAGRAFGAGFAD